MDWVVCPECAHPAEVTWRGTASGASVGDGVRQGPLPAAALVPAAERTAAGVAVHAGVVRGAIAVTEIHRGRFSADIDGDFVVFLIGMRPNKPWQPAQMAAG